MVPGTVKEMLHNTGGGYEFVQLQQYKTRWCLATTFKTLVSNTVKKHLKKQ